MWKQLAIFEHKSTMLKSSVNSRLIVQYILIARWTFILFLRSKWTPQMKQLHRSLSQTTERLVCKTTLNRSILHNIYSKVQCVTASCLVHTDLQNMTETFWMYFDMPDSLSCTVHAVKTNRSVPMSDPSCQTDSVHAHSLIFFAFKVSCQSAIQKNWQEWKYVWSKFKISEKFSTWEILNISLT